MNRRRFLAASALMALLPATVRAQLSPLGGCTPTFLNGLLQFDPECAMTVPGAPFEFSPPSHLITPFEGTASAVGDVTTPKERRRAHVRARINRNQDQRDQRLFTKRAQQDRRQATQQDRRFRRHERKIRCNDFFFQEDAQAFFEGENYDSAKDPRGLDGNNDGVACGHLPYRDECNRFKYQEDAQNYFDNTEYDKKNDPLKLDPDKDGKACEGRPKKPL